VIPSGPLRVAQPDIGGGHKTLEETNKMGLKEFASGAAQNVPESVGNVFSGLYDAATNPSQTWGAIKQIGSGIASKASGALGGERTPENENVLNALLNEYADTYSSWSGFKNKLYNDPAFIGMDAATALGGAGAAAKVAGAPAKAIKAISMAEKVLDPVQGAIAAAKAPVKLAGAIGKTSAATASGVPKIAYDMAQAAGASKDPAARKAFSLAASGKMDSQQLADTALKSLDELKQQASNEYKTTHASISRDPVDTTPIHDKISEIEDRLGANTPTTIRDPATGNMITTTVGLVHASEELKRLQKMREIIEAVDNSANPMSRTVDGVDSAKKAIDDILGDYKGNKMGLLNEVKTSTKGAINAVDKTYGDMLDRWSDWRRQLKDLQTQLVGTNNSSDSVRIAKLLKTLGNERKMNLLRMISNTPSGQYLAEMIAGHALSGWGPASGRGLIDVLAGGGLYYAGAHPAAIAGGAALVSPKIGGQLANKAGMAGRMIGNVAPPQVAMKPLSMTGNLEEDRTQRKSGGRVSSHDTDADQLVRAAERAKKGWSAQTEPLLNQSDEAVAHALEVANRSI
jgi:hypothetical protein